MSRPRILFGFHGRFTRSSEEPSRTFHRAMLAAWCSFLLFGQGVIGMLRQDASKQHVSWKIQLFRVVTLTGAVCGSLYVICHPVWFFVVFFVLITVVEIDEFMTRSCK